jgi:hypothetical protein
MDAGGLIAMVHMLTEEDKILLAEKPRLVECLFDKVAKGPFDRLIVHRAAATMALNINNDMAKIAIQRLNNPPSLSKSNDIQAYRRVPTVAMLIKAHDPGIIKVLEQQKVAYNDSNRMFELFARLVIGHETDQDCGEILRELGKVGLPTIDGTCD